MKAKEWVDKFNGCKNLDEFSKVMDEFIAETTELAKKRKDVESSVREQNQKWQAIVRKISKFENNIFLDCLQECVPAFAQSYFQKRKQLVDHKTQQNSNLLHKLDLVRGESDIGRRLVKMWGDEK